MIEAVALSPMRHRLKRIMKVPIFVLTRVNPLTPTLSPNHGGEGWGEGERFVNTISRRLISVQDNLQFPQTNVKGLFVTLCLCLDHVTRLIFKNYHAKSRSLLVTGACFAGLIQA